MASPDLVPCRPWQGRRVLLGVTGGVAAYKAVQVARNLTRLEAQVDVVLTRGAQEFVAPLSFEGVTGRPALTKLFSTDGAAMPGAAKVLTGDTSTSSKMPRDRDRRR